MLLSYAQVLAILSDLHMISDDGLPAFKARLRRLQSVGIPQGANTGKGQRVQYSFEMIIELVIAIEFMQAGLTPQALAEIVSLNRERIYNSVLFTMLMDGEDADLIIALNPQSLREFTAIETTDEAYLNALSVVSRSEFAEYFRHGQPYEVPYLGEPWRWIFLILRPLLSALVAHIQERLQITFQQFSDIIFDLARKRFAVPEEIEHSVRFGFIFQRPDNGDPQA